MIREGNYDEFTRNLYKGITEQFITISNDSNYHSKLPSEIQYIESDMNTYDYGHPINWVLYGKTGIHGFIIGIITEENQVFDDMSENNYYPPTIPKHFFTSIQNIVISKFELFQLKEKLTMKETKCLKGWNNENRTSKKV